MTDWQLLQDYVNKKSEAAFARLVEKHLKLVYAVCYRETADEQVAEDAVQAVFLLLSQKAGSIAKGASLAGWLFTASHLVSRNARRREMRRKKAEAAAALEMENFTPGGVWTQIDPHLNEALAALAYSDRQAVLLRYFEDLSVREVADELGSTESAAKIRIWRSLQKMRQFLATKGVALTAVVLSAELAAHPAKAVPEACRQSALNSIHGYGKGYLAAHPHVGALHKGVHFTMQAMRYKTSIAAVAVLGVVAVIGIPTIWHITHSTLSATTTPVSGSLTVPPAFVNNGNTGKWVHYGGKWTTSGKWLNNVQQGTAIAVLSESQFSNFTYDADITVTGTGDSGLIFRVSSPAVGLDAYQGYYLGLDPTLHHVGIGKSSGVWKELKFHPYPVHRYVPYHVRVKAVGSVISIYLQGKYLFSISDSSYASGAIGLRTHNDTAAFTNLTVSKSSR